MSVFLIFFIYFNGNFLLRGVELLTKLKEGLGKVPLLDAGAQPKFMQNLVRGLRHQQPFTGNNIKYFRNFRFLP